MSTRLDANHAYEGQIRRCLDPAGSREPIESGLPEWPVRTPSLSGAVRCSCTTPVGPSRCCVVRSSISPPGALVPMATAPPLEFANLSAMPAAELPAIGDDTPVNAKYVLCERLRTMTNHLRPGRGRPMGDGRHGHGPAGLWRRTLLRTARPTCIGYGSTGWPWVFQQIRMV